MQSADNATTVIHKRVVLCGSGMGSSPSYFSTLGNLTTTCAINVFKVREKRCMHADSLCVELSILGRPDPVESHKFIVVTDQQLMVYHRI